MAETEIKSINGRTLFDATSRQRIGELFDEFSEVSQELLETVSNLSQNKADKTDLTSPFNFKGSTTYSELPTSGNAINDTYYCTDMKRRYTWNGESWYPSSLDETEYTDELNQLSEEIEEVKSDLVELESAIFENERVYVSADKITTISGCKPITNNTYNLFMLQSESKSNTQIFKVVKDVECTIHGYGNNDAEINPYAIFSPILTQNINDGKSLSDAHVFSGDSQTYQYWDATYTPSVDGYIYISGTNATVTYLSEVKNIKKDCGLYVANGEYIHFTRVNDERYICRVFKNCFVNNLLQLQRMFVGHIENGAIVQDSVIGTSYSDVVGPISIHRKDTDSWIGSWSGGTHGITIDDTEYPTAEQNSIEVYVDEEKIEAEGLYFGKVTIKTVNKLYYPKSITGADLSQAELAITEHRTYTLTDKMNVKVRLVCEADSGAIRAYYGCQCNTYNMAEVYLPSNEIKKSLNPAESEVYKFEKPESKYYCISSDGHAHYDVELKPIGLGTLAHNDGTDEEYLYGNVATFQKIYYQLIANTTYVTKGKEYMWEADYNYYFD